MILCHHQGIPWCGVKTGQVEVSETASLLEPSRLLSCKQLVPCWPPRHFGTIPVDDIFLYLTARYPNHKSSLESHDPLTFLKQGLLRGGGPRGKLQSEQRRLTCICEPLQVVLYEFLNENLASEGCRFPGSNLEREDSIICSKYIK
jgi:hypothetical protein